MSNETKSRRRIRLQFSLRAILVLMALVGVALTIYRWPWVETKEIDDPVDGRVTQSTTYRRGWRGKTNKYGLRTSIFRGPSRSQRGHTKLRYEEWFSDDELRWWAIYDAQGELLAKHHYRNEKLNGPAYENSGKFVGQYT